MNCTCDTGGSAGCPVHDAAVMTDSKFKAHGYVKPEVEDRLADAKRQGQAQFESILEMVQELRGARADNEIAKDDAASWKAYNAAEQAEQRIHEYALSVEVRSDWYVPTGTVDDAIKAVPAEYRILLCTGGPACQIVGTLNEHCEPETARMEVQDWFQPWTEYRPQMLAGAPGEAMESDSPAAGCQETAQDVMLAYARCFWFGE